MTFTLNRVLLAGHLTRDPEIKQVNENTSVTKIGLAVNRRYRDRNGESRDEVLFVECEAWNRTAEVIAEYMSKGRPILVEGRLRLDQWQNEQGEKRSRIKVVIDRFQFVPEGRRNDAETGRGPDAVREERPGYAAASAASGPPRPAYAATRADELF